ncbi:hypothetical protein LFM09_00270 [Lentzea alba]|uniref:hypothetical protein n=1 Tax=Lentzea alba TaxID=2714351 RepID=UPI0039BF634E
MDEEALSWLLDSDPAIRWQVLRDLCDAPAAEWEAERARVAVEGWGAELLSHRDASGRWTPKIYGEKWISTTYSLLELRQYGLPGEVVRDSCALFLTDDIWRKDMCIAGFALALLSWAGLPHDEVLQFVLAGQLEDGGWNCVPARHSSFHTTINVLDGLPDLAAAERGREFLLQHRLFRSHRTGEVVKPEFLRPVFPPRWRYDTLRALDHFWAADALDDERLSDALGELEKRERDGRWKATAPHPGKVWFEVDQARWNTLRALRVLRGAGRTASPA